MASNERPSPIPCRFGRFSTRAATAALLALAAAFAAHPQGAPARIIFVDRDAHGANDGSSWADAFTSIRAAVAASHDGDEIWIAEGLYTETEYVNKPLRFYGGFAGTESSRDQRDPDAHPTTVTAAWSNTVFWLAAPCRLDGLNIADGKNTQMAGGVACTAGGAASMTTTTIARCRIAANAAPYGGGIFCWEDRLELVDCEITGNTAGSGGAIYAYNSYVRIENCTISDNRADSEGGAIFAYSGEVAVAACTVIGSTIAGNHAGDNGGGLYTKSVYHGFVLLSADRCIIAYNTGANGGGLRLGGVAKIFDSLIVGNRAVGAGGALDCFQADATLLNCTVADNHASRDAAFSTWGGRLLASNCIVYYNGDDPFGGEQIWIQSSCVERGYPGAGNISDAPRFADRPSGDYHLAPASPCIDAGDDSLVESRLAADLDGRPRILDGDHDGRAAVDMGAYEADFYTDLVARGFDFSPDRIGRGEAVLFTGEILNAGTLPTSGPFWVEFIASPTPDLNGPVYYLCPSLRVAASIAPGQAFDLSTVQRTLDPSPPGPPDGLYFVGVRIDPLGEIEESDESNNCAWVVSHQLCAGCSTTGAAPRWALYR